MFYFKSEDLHKNPRNYTLAKGKYPLWIPLASVYLFIFLKMHDEIQVPNTSETLDTQKLEKAIFMNFEKRASYKKEWWNKKWKQYKRITINLDDINFADFERLAKLKNRKISEIVKLSAINGLHWWSFDIKSKEDTQNKQEITKQALQVFRNLGTNINQIARDLNERRLMGGLFSNSNLTKSEKEQLLFTIQKMEAEMMDFIKNNL